ncbi:hypothetical protein EOB49_33370, partial [Mesorhizobium sp. M7A.F.Ca.MR.148.00.0.0]
MRRRSKIGQGAPRYVARCPSGIAEVSAAPHCPAGHFSPYRTGRKTPSWTVSPIGASDAAISLLPVSIRGEGAGRR